MFTHLFVFAIIQYVPTYKVRRLLYFQNVTMYVLSYFLAYYIQMQRRKRIKDVCKQYAETIGSWDPTSFKGRSPLYSEQIRRDAFLIASLPPTILCYNHKAKSLETQ